MAIIGLAVCIINLALQTSHVAGDTIPINVQSLVGQSVNLPCRASNKSIVQWTYFSSTGKSTHLSFSSGSGSIAVQYTVSSSLDGWHNLTLIRFHVAIAGLYVCSDNNGSRRSYSVQLPHATEELSATRDNRVFVPIIICSLIIGGFVVATVVRFIKFFTRGGGITTRRQHRHSTDSATQRPACEPSYSLVCTVAETAVGCERRRSTNRRVRWASKDKLIPSKPYKRKTKEITQTTYFEDSTDSSDDDVVNPWNVQAKSPKGCDLNKLIQRFGATPVDDILIAHIESLIQRRAHHLLRRNHFFSHRDLQMILHCHETKRPFYLYTGRGPSTSAMHIGHLVPFIFTKWLQDTFDVPVVIQMTDDEKFLWGDASMEETRCMTKENAKDIIAVGFDVNKTFIFADTDFVSDECYKNVCRIWKCIPLKRVKRIFGMSDTSATGKVAFPAIQAAPAFSSSFPLIFNGKPDVPCLIPCAMDQDPFFRLTRDVAPKLGYRKPAIVHSTFVPSLHGAQSKMSSSVPTSCIYLTDTEDVIREKVINHAFSGGRATLADHRKYGGDCEIDVSFKILSFFLEDDDRLEEIRTKYSRGELLSGELKQELISVVGRIVADHQDRRHHVTDELVEQFMKPRKLNYDL